MNQTTRVFLQSLGFTKKVRFILMRVLDMLMERLGRNRHFSTTYSFINQLMEHGVSLSDRQQRYCLGYEGKTFLVRKYSSDEQVFTDVVLHGEYQQIMDLADTLNIDVRTILDAGANAGLTTLVFASRFPTAEIVSLEPDRENYELLAANVEHSALQHVKALNAGLSHEDGWLVPGNGLDAREWGKTFSYAGHTSEHAVVAYTISSVMEMMGWADVDLLKIDIEGGEKDLFRAGKSEFLSRVKLLAVEIHESGDKIFIHELLKKTGFFYFEQGDLTVAVNRRWIG
jgi:FkbM family methyltransferase